MCRRRLLTFAALVAAHAITTLVNMWCFAYTTGPGEFVCGVLLLPMILLGQTQEGHVDWGSLIGVSEDSPYWLVPFVSVNGLLWMTPAYGLWLASRWAWKVWSSLRSLPASETSIKQGSTAGRSTS